MDIRPSEITSILKKEIENIDKPAAVTEAGTVLSIGDGISRVYGLDNAQAGELVVFERTKQRGMVFNLEADSVGIVLLGDGKGILEGDKVVRTKEMVSVPVGPGLLGRVVDALGNPIDGLGPLKNVEMRPIEIAAPGIMDRKSVGTPMFTGIKSIDALIPIGRGQRELILGDRQTGKTTVVTDSFIAQKEQNAANNPKTKMHCIYVAIGQKRSSVANLVRMLTENGAMSYTTVVVASGSEAAALQYLAPFSGTTMGEYFRDNGQHALISYDDLSKHAAAYRQMSLLMRRPPGREAYPGDVFYLHSRLLERSAQLSDDKGAGSLTSLPIVETLANDVSAYIPTNVISITDGQLFLETNLFFAGVRPAINAGSSVSRVGSAAQIKAMKQVAGPLKLELARYREMAAFSQFASDLDESTRKLLDRGARLTQIMIQPETDPLSVGEEVLVLYAGTKGFLDKVAVDKVREYEAELLRSARSGIGSFTAIVEQIEAEKKISDDLAKELNSALTTFSKKFESK